MEDLALLLLGTSHVVFLARLRLGAETDVVHAGTSHVVSLARLRLGAEPNVVVAGAIDAVVAIVIFACVVNGGAISDIDLAGTAFLADTAALSGIRASAAVSSALLV